MGALHDGRVDEAAVREGQRARLRPGRLDHLPGRVDLLGGGQVGALDDRELAGVDGRPAEEAQGPAPGAAGRQCLQVGDVGVDRLGRGGRPAARAATTTRPRGQSRPLSSRTPRSARRSASPSAMPRTAGWAVAIA